MFDFHSSGQKRIPGLGFQTSGFANRNFGLRLASRFEQLGAEMALCFHRINSTVPIGTLDALDGLRRRKAHPRPEHRGQRAHLAWAPREGWGLDSSARNH